MGSSPGGSSQPDGQDDIVQFGRSRRRPHGLGPLLLACLVAVAVVAVVLRSGPHRHSVPPPPPPVAVSDAGHPILGIRAGWELFGLRRASLVAVQFSRGQITRTALPPPEGGGPVSLVVEPGKVIIRPLDNVPGYLVPDGQPARQLTGALAHGALLLPGPAAGEVWDIGWTQSISLLNVQGRPTRVRLAAMSARFPAQSSMADGRGGVLLFDKAGHQYDAWTQVLRPVGALLVAVGPRDWLGLSCDQHGTCRNVAITTATGAIRTLPGRSVSVINWPWPDQPGTAAPDGSTAAVLVEGPRQSTILELVSLRSGTVTQIAVPIGPHASSQTLAWSPDSRWLFVVTASGRLDAVNPRTGHTQDLGPGLSGLTQIAIRGLER